ncbi:MAG: FecR family protein [Rikenellaceae bacterium]|nr:FecR family protein [Rikenellaceae bacterium]
MDHEFERMLREAEHHLHPTPSEEVERRLTAFRRQRKSEKTRRLRLGAAAGLTGMAIALTLLTQPRPTAVHFSGMHSVYVVDDSGNRIELEQIPRIIGHTELIGDHTLQYNLPENLAVPARYTLVVPEENDFRLSLSDGTVVHIRAGSNLEYPAYFLPDADRGVEIHYGEFFLEVARDDSSPFVVSTPVSVTQVLGTRFRVRSHPDRPSQITLVQGSVRVKNREQDWSGGVRLTPGQNATVTGEQITVGQVDILDYISWVEGYYYFDRKTVKEILDRICSDYGYRLEGTITNQDPIRFWFEKSEDIEQVIFQLCELAHVEVEITDNLIVVR